MIEHYKKLERMYLGANMNSNYYQSTQVDIGKETCTIHLDISPKYFHALNAVHGSVYFKLLDDAAFFSAQSIIDDYFILTANYELNLLKPIFKGRIKAIGTLVSRQDRTLVAKADLFNEENELLASGKGIFKVSRLELRPEVGYV